MISRAWNAFWFTPTPPARLALVRIIVLLLAQGTLDVVFYQVTDTAEAGTVGTGRYWNPIYLFELAGIGPFSPGATHVLIGVLKTAIVCGVLGVFTRTSCFVVAVLCFYFWGMAYSIGQVHHEKITLIFTLMALPFSPCGRRFSVDALIASRFGRRSVAGASEWAAWPIRLAQVTMAFGYFFAGATKLASGGLDWANGYTLQGHMLASPGPWSDMVSASPVYTRGLSLMLLFIQVTFPLVFLVPRSRWFYLPAAMSFHLISRQTMGTGLYDTLWVLLLVFLPLESIPAWFAANYRRHRVAILFATGVSACGIGLYVMQVWDRYPPYFRALCVAIGVAALIGTARSARQRPVTS